MAVNDITLQCSLISKYLNNIIYENDHTVRYQRKSNLKTVYSEDYFLERNLRHKNWHKRILNDIVLKWEEGEGVNLR